MLQVKTLRRDDRGVFPEPEGDIVNVFEPIGPGVEKLRVLVRVDDDVLDDPTDTDTDEVSLTYYCGVNDCSREVDGPDESCWQHED